MIFGLYLQSVMAQSPYDQKQLIKYCRQEGTEEVKAEVVLKNGINTIICHGGRKSPLWFYETVNMELNRSPDEQFDKAFYSSAEWEKYLKSLFVK